MAGKNKACQIMALVSDQNIYKIMDSEQTDDINSETMGMFLIHDVLRKRFYYHIEFFAGKTRFIYKNSLQWIEKILNRKLGYYIRKWESEEEKQGAIKAYEYIKKQFNEIINST